MSTAIRNAQLTRIGEPLSRGRSLAGRRWQRRVIRLLAWAAARPALTAVSLALAYVVALAALVGVLAASALNTLAGIVVLVFYVAMVLVLVAVAVYVVIPERRRNQGATIR